MKTLEEKLNTLAHWPLVADKKNVLKGLKNHIYDSETIIDMLDGIFLNTTQSARGNEPGGVLFLTDSRLIFIPSKSGTKPFEVSRNELVEITRTAETSPILSIETKESTVYFRSFMAKGADNTFIDRANDNQFVEASSHKKNQQYSSAAKTAKELTDLLSVDAITGFISKINALQKDMFASDSPTQSPAAPETSTGSFTDPVTEIEKNDFLFREAKKITAGLSSIQPLQGDPELKKYLVNDLIALSTLCSMADRSFQEQELVLMSLVIMPLNPTNDTSAELLTKELDTHKSFPMHLKDRVIEYWDTISAYIKNNKPGVEGQSLMSLNHLKKYDEMEGTGYYDQASALLHTYCQCLIKADDRVTPEEQERLSQIRALLKNTEEVEQEIKEDEKEETLEEVMEKINKLIGMDKIKKEISTFINLIKVKKEREERKLPVTPLSLHAVFYGPPGTGKTTIARLLGKVYKCLGLLTKGHLTETDRAGLVAGYVGQTAIKVDELVTKSLDGVLFIDEAYTLSAHHGGKDFGQEAIDTILKRMEDYRDRFVVIAAGYPDEMKEFIESNPGLQSRFSRYFYFDHYTPDELIRIFDIFSGNVAFTVVPEAREKLLALLTLMYETRNRSFGNGRVVRNLFEKIVERQANRISEITPLTDEILCTITVEDIPTMEDLEH